MNASLFKNDTVLIEIFSKRQSERRFKAVFLDHIPPQLKGTSHLLHVAVSLGRAAWKACLTDQSLSKAHRLLDTVNENVVPLRSVFLAFKVATSPMVHEEVSLRTCVSKTVVLNEPVIRAYSTALRVHHFVWSLQELSRLRPCRIPPHGVRCGFFHSSGNKKYPAI
jgi:hypothetical protein